jgi:murein DD-endopeptidase MepM/ murein hydrolase activator NlpD
MIELLKPWPEGYTINARSPYGPRRHPITGRTKFHHGIDVAMPVGTTLRAAADGTIAHKGAGASGGYTLLIRHAGNWHTVYYHLQQPSHRNIGEQISAGDIVAKSGNTGASTGPHLHFELRRSRTWGDTVDPVPYFRRPERSEQPTEEPTRSHRSPSKRPSRVGRVSPGLAAWSRSWVARGAHAIRRGLGR